MEVSAPTEVHGKQARQVLGQKRAGAAEAGYGDEGVISLCPSCRSGEGVERIDRVQAGVHRRLLHSGVHRREVRSKSEPRRVSISWRITAMSSAMSNRRLTSSE